MRIGMQLGLHGLCGKHEQPTPRWDNIRQQVAAVEAAGFDLCVIEDGLVDGGMGTYGYWESVSLAGAVAEASTGIEIAHSVINAPLRPPGLVAKAAETLDEISGGRYTLGISAGNTPNDYPAFGVPADKRCSRFAEAIEIIHSLLKSGEVTFDGEYHSAATPLVPRGPRPQGLPIVIGARGPRMIRLAVRFGDGWNGWTEGPQTLESFRPLVDELERACDELDRDPTTLRRTLEIAVDPRDYLGKPPSSLSPHLVGGTSDEIAASLLRFGELGVEEVRCMIWPEPTPDERLDVIAAMADVVDQLHAA